MRTPSASELLELWERGLTQPRESRALLLLTASCVELSIEQASQWSLGRRDAHLFHLREALFGPDLEAFVVCPRCGDQLELSFSTSEMRGRSGLERGGEATLQIGTFDIRLRAPNTADLLSVRAAEVEEGRDHILRRCLLSVHDRDRNLAFDAVPGDVVDAAVAKMEEIDPLANIEISICCEACGHTWRAAFDVVSFLWKEIEAWSRRTLAEVHTLAVAYGWCERDILSLSAGRRQFYLDMVGA